MIQCANMLRRDIPYPIETTFPKLDAIDVALPEAPTSVDFAFVHHGAFTGLPSELKEKFEESDAILLEGVLWTRELHEIINRITEGDKDALRSYLREWVPVSPKPAFDRTTARALFDIGKPVAYCDIPRTPKNLQLSESILNTRIDNDSAKTVADVQQIAINYVQDFLVNGLYARDKYIIQNLYSTLASLVANSQSESPTNAVFVLGSTHRTVSLGLRRQIAETSSQSTHSISETMYAPADLTSRVYEDFLKGNKIKPSEALKAFLASSVPLEIRPDEETLEGADDESLKKIVISCMGMAGIRLSQ